MVGRVAAELGGGSSGEGVTVIATGGYAPIVVEEAGCFNAVEENLNLEGLRLVYEANRPEVDGRAVAHPETDGDAARAPSASGTARETDTESGVTA